MRHQAPISTRTREEPFSLVPELPVENWLKANADP